MRNYPMGTMYAVLGMVIIKAHTSPLCNIYMKRNCTCTSKSIKKRKKEKEI